MDKILAPTDFSNNSRRGMRFAMQWATQQKMEIVYPPCLSSGKLSELD